MVRSWTFGHADGFGTLLEALRALALPTVPARDCAVETLRMPLPDESGRIHTLTALKRGGRIVSVSAFDEPPEWLDP